MDAVRARRKKKSTSSEENDELRKMLAHDPKYLVKELISEEIGKTISPYCCQLFSCNLTDPAFVYFSA